MQEKRRTIHVYFEEEEPELVEAGAEPELEVPTRYVGLGVFLGLLLSFLCISIPLLSVFLPPLSQNTYDTSISRTMTLTLGSHPAAGQAPLYTLPRVSVRLQATVAATGSVHQFATTATGLLTFYNGLFASQTILAGTTFKGKDGIAVVTSHNAVIPPATPTTPPTYGTVSVTAVSSVSGELGNIAASDIDQACCGPSILAQNLYAFSGGQDARDIPILTRSDLSTGSQALTTQADEAVNGQAQQETRPGTILLPLDCAGTLVASHQAGDQALASTLTLTKTCTPLAYAATDIAKQAQLRIAIPKGYHLVSFSAFVAGSNIGAQGGTLTVQAIAYLKQDTPVVRTSHFAGK